MNENPFWRSLKGSGLLRGALKSKIAGGSDAPRLVPTGPLISCHFRMKNQALQIKRSSRQSLFFMAIFLLLFVVPVCLPSSVRAAVRDKAKIIEEYVVSAKFDENKNLPQLNDRIQSREETRSRHEVKEGSLLVPSGLREGGYHFEDFDKTDCLEERDFMVHHHHLPAVPHPPQHPPPVGLAYAPSLFAVGLIVFFILLNSLQTSFLLLKSKGSLLGPVAGALGRRKRFALENSKDFLGNLAGSGFNVTAIST